MDDDFDADFLSDHGEDDPVTPVPTRPSTHIVAAASKQLVFSNDSFFPAPVAYQVEQCQDQLYWDVMYIFDQFKIRVPVKSSKMMVMLKELASSKGYLGFKSIHFRRRQSSTMLQANVVSTSLVIAWYMSLIDSSRLDTKIDYGKECLKNLSSVIMQFCRSSGGFGFNVDGFDVSVDALGFVTNFAGVPGSHQTSLQHWSRTWDHLNECGHVMTKWEDTRWSLCDVVLFSVFFQWSRKKRSLRQCGTKSDRKLSCLQDELVLVLTDCYHQYIWQEYATRNNVYNRRVPSRQLALSSRWDLINNDCNKMLFQ